MKALDILQTVPEESGSTAMSPSKTMPNFKIPPGLSQVARDNIEVYKLEQMQEVEGIKSRLDKDNCPHNVAVIQKAVVLPEKLEFNAETRKYPTPEVGLMINPFPKKKATKGKKKGKKR